jgi:ankyrin repeat protein
MESKDVQVEDNEDINTPNAPGEEIAREEFDPNAFVALIDPEDPKRLENMSVMMDAVWRGDRPLVKWLCNETEPDLNVADSYGTTAIMYAASRDAYELCQELKQNGADLHLKDKFGQGPLVYAAFGNAKKVVRWLIETCGVNILEVDNADVNVLHKVAQHGLIEMVREFVEEFKMDLNLKTPDGETALMKAASAGQLEIVKWLLVDYPQNYAADSTNLARTFADPSERNAKGNAAWRLAGANRHFETMKWLVDHGGEDVNSQTDSEGFTLMGYASREGNLELVKILLEDMKADVHQITLDGRTGLMDAAANGHVEVVKFLLEHNANADQEDFNGRNAAMLAINNRKWKVVQVITEYASEGLADKGPQWNALMQRAEDEKGGPFTVYAFMKKLGEVSVLEQIDRYGRNFFFHAAYNGRLDQIEPLVEEGNFDITAKCKAKESPYFGENVLDVSFSKKWFIPYLWMFLQLLVKSSDPPVSMVRDHFRVFEQLESPDVADFIEKCQQECNKSGAPVILALKFYIMFNELANMDRIHRSTYTKAFEKFNAYAVSMFARVPSPKLQSWVLEEKDRLGQAVISLALNSNNIDFISEPCIDRIMENWWQQVDFAEHNHLHFPPFHMFLKPSFKLAMHNVGFFAFEVLFFIVAMEFNQIDADMSNSESLLFLTTLGYFVVEIGELSETGLADYASDGWNRVDLGITLGLGILFVLRILKQANSLIVYVFVMCALSLLICLRTFEMFLVHETLGPLMISLQKMVSDITTFGVLFIVVAMGFYFAFKFVINVGAEGLEIKDYGDSEQTLISIFNAAVGGFDFDPFGDMTLGPRVISEVLGALLNLVLNLVMLNLLIAMMGVTYDEVKQRSDKEFRFLLVQTRWKFDQSPLRLPSPLNLISFVLWNIWKGIRHLRRNKSHGHRQVAASEEAERGGCVSSIFDNLPDRCSYCHTVWRTTKFNINRPPVSKRQHRFDAATLAVFFPEEAGLRLCDSCIRCKKLVEPEIFVRELLDMCILTVVYWLPRTLLFVLNLFVTNRLKERSVKADEARQAQLARTNTEEVKELRVYKFYEQLHKENKIAEDNDNDDENEDKLFTTRGRRARRRAKLKEKENKLDEKSPAISDAPAAT